MVRTKYVVCVLLFFCLVPFAGAEEQSVTRRDGFLLMWESIKRPAEPAKTRFSDVPESARGSLEIDYAAQRGIIDDSQPLFRPDDPLLLRDALIVLFRTRNVADDPDEVREETLDAWLERYPVAHYSSGSTETMTEEDLVRIIGLLDEILKEEVHEVSLYAENFHGDGTAFGETFDMHAMTAAHRSFPHHTLVKVTNEENGKSVVVRINDRGPYVKGRNMDLSLGAFTAIAERSRGKISARFERLGDARLIDQPADATAAASVAECSATVAIQRRINKGVVLTPGIPTELALGESLSLRGNKPFVVRQVTYPDGTRNRIQDFVLHGESFSFKPSVEGVFTFLIGSIDGRTRTLATNVLKCN